jgi:hypothetical protein
VLPFGMRKSLEDGRKSQRMSFFFFFLCSQLFVLGCFVIFHFYMIIDFYLQIDKNVEVHAQMSPEAVPSYHGKQSSLS